MWKTREIAPKEGAISPLFHIIMYTRDVRNELLIVLQLDIHVGHDKNQYIPV